MITSFFKTWHNVFVTRARIKPIKKSFIFNSVWLMIFPDMCTFTPPVSQYFLFCFPTELYHYVYLTYHRTVLHFVLSNPSSWRQPPEGVSPFHKVRPHRGYPLSWRQLTEGGIPLLWRQPSIWTHFFVAHTFHNDPLLHPTLGSNFIKLLLVAILNKLKRRCTSWRHFRLVSVVKRATSGPTPSFDDLSRWPEPKMPRADWSRACHVTKCCTLIGSRRILFPYFGVRIRPYGFDAPASQPLSHVCPHSVPLPFTRP